MSTHRGGEGRERTPQGMESMTSDQVQSNAIRLSVIVPVYNNAREALQCLGALRRCLPADSEIIVVDDASTDDTVARLREAEFRVLRRAANGGPGAARNDGARAARGRVLLFVDADVVIATDGVTRVLTTLEQSPDTAAVFGSYDASPRAPGLVSQYRNLLHHFVHQEGNPTASTFWAGCGAVRRDVFVKLGGFDAGRFPRPSIEDIELGYRLRAAGHRILLDKDLQGTHLKRWTLRSVIRTDVVCRAVPWARLNHERGATFVDLNLKASQRISAGLVGLAVGCLMLGVAVHPGFALGAVAAAAGVVALNRDFFGFLRRRRGLAFAVASIPLHLLYFLYSGLSYVFVRLEHLLRSSAHPHTTAVGIDRRGGDQ
jgi:GT2 family glycosyltransferase